MVLARCLTHHESPLPKNGSAGVSCLAPPEASSSSMVAEDFKAVIPSQLVGALPGYCGRRAGDWPVFFDDSFYSTVDFCCGSRHAGEGKHSFRHRRLLH